MRSNFEIWYLLRLRFSLYPEIRYYLNGVPALLEKKEGCREAVRLLLGKKENRLEVVRLLLEEKESCLEAARLLLGKKES